MDSLGALNRLPRHRGLLERAVARFRDDDRVLGLVLGGSLALGGADSYSDVDLYVIVRDEAFEAVFTKRDAAARTIGSPLFCFTVEPVPGAVGTLSSPTLDRSSSTSCTTGSPSWNPARNGKIARCSKTTPAPCPLWCPGRRESGRTVPEALVE